MEDEFEKINLDFSNDLDFDTNNQNEVKEAKKIIELVGTTEERINTLLRHIDEIFEEGAD